MNIINKYYRNNKIELATYLFVTLFLVSCYQNSQKLDIEKTFDIVKVKIDENKIDTTFYTGTFVKKIKFSNLKYIGLADTIMILIDEGVKPRIRYFDIYNELEIGVLKADRSDNTFLVNPFYFNQYYYHKGRLFYNLVDLKKNCIYNIDLDRSRIDSSYKWTKSKLIPHKLALKYNSLYVTKDSLLIGTYRGNRDLRNGLGGKLYLYDTRASRLFFSKYSPLTEQIRNIRSNEYPYYYYNYSCFNEKLQVLASFNRLFPQVDFVNTNTGKTLSLIRKGKNTPPSIDSAFPIKMSTKEYYYSSFAGKKYAYGLCLNAEHKSFVNDTGFTELHLYKWEGDLYKVIKLDKARLINFIVFEEKGLLVASHYSDSTGYSLIKYNIGVN